MLVEGIVKEFYGFIFLGNDVCSVLLGVGWMFFSGKCWLIVGGCCRCLICDVLLVFDVCGC